MATDVSTNLNDNLLKEKIFNCKICDELCISDIFLIIGKGNVCSKCYEQCEDKSRAELNSALIFVMSQLILPCKYEFKGCIKKLTCKNYERHINVCEYKVKPCPMLMYDDCKWNGNNLEISEHISTEHTEHVIKSENNIFKVETSLSETYNIKLLIGDYKSCLLKTSIVDNKFYYAMNPIFQCKENVEYSVKHKSKETQNSSTTVGTLTKLNSIYSESNLHKNPNATIVDMDLLKHLADENNTIVNEFNLNPSGIDEKTLKLLECPVCFNTMRPPIYQCSSGHSICILCHDKVQKCPTCDAQWAKSRNYIIEGLTYNLKYPCRFKELGCKEFGTELQVSKHEESCPVNNKPKGKGRASGSGKKAPNRKAKNPKNSTNEGEDESDSSSKNEPLAKKAKGKKPPTDDEIKAYIKNLLEGANLEEITMKDVCINVFSHYPDLVFSLKKDFIIKTIKLFLTT
ncbi:unnamed protein product [Brassicogethes aeneus]|uniref:RING-type E3 ubiquitin transferase n=1 Tax=Brassicogethes aeneus TaxID=1431903 RepID=A0A9P0B6V0_BRAAE|nr:unnamed protein product [Brassicogethes aeneus]